MDGLHTIMDLMVRERVEGILQAQLDEGQEEKREKEKREAALMDEICFSLSEDQREFLDRQMSDMMESKCEACEAVYKTGVQDGIRLMKMVERL